MSLLALITMMLGSPVNVSKIHFIINIILLFITGNCTDGEIRLGDDAVLRGRVEVCINNIWTTICASYWTDNEATVICSQLGYSHYGKLNTKFERPKH